MNPGTKFSLSHRLIITLFLVKKKLKTPRDNRTITLTCISKELQLNFVHNISEIKSSTVKLETATVVYGGVNVLAVWLFVCAKGYRFRRAYIGTQGPLAETSEDFWRMLWEHNCNIVVMLTKLREVGRVRLHLVYLVRPARYSLLIVLYLLIFFLFFISAYCTIIMVN